MTFSRTPPRRKCCRDPAPYRRFRRRHAMVVAQPLRDRRHRHRHASQSRDPVAVRLDPRPGRRPQPPDRPPPGTTGRSAAHHSSSSNCSRRRVSDPRRSPAPDTSRSSCGRCPDASAICPWDRPACQWVNNSIRSNHVHDSPRHQAPSRTPCRAPESERTCSSTPTPCRTRPRGGELRDGGVGNYVTDNPSTWGIT